MTLITHSTHANPWTMPERLANAAITCVVYLGQLFWPVGLYAFYSYPETGWPAWQVAGAVLLLLTITAVAVIWRRRLPYLLVGWFWYLGMLLPVLGLTYVSPAARADRYTYLSQIGLYIGLVWGAMQLAAAWPARRWVFAAGSAATLIALSACSWRQTGYWRDELSLWRHALASNSKNPAAHFNLATALEGGDDPAAAAEYEQSLAMETDHWPVYDLQRAQAENSLGNIELRKPDAEQAIVHFRRALRWNPDFIPALVSLAEQLAKRGDFDEALAFAEKAAVISPKDAAQAYCKLADAQGAAGQNDDALDNYDRALQASDNFAEAHVNLARLLVARGAIDTALVHLRRAIEIDPEPPLPYPRDGQAPGRSRKAGRSGRL